MAAVELGSGSRYGLATPWLERLAPDVRQWLLGELAQVLLRGGETLFRAGDPADAVYLVVSGALGAFAADDETRLIGQVVAGETVGETGLITGQPRSATVRALRDCELLRLSSTTFDQLAQRDPHVLLAMARLALQRATSPEAGERRKAGPRTLALLAQCDGLDARGFAAHLALVLGPYGDAVVVDEALGHGRDSGFFHTLELEHRFVIYVAGDGLSPWRELCLRQADAVLYLAEAGAQPAAWSEALRGLGVTMPRPEHLALVHRGKPRLGAARRWEKYRPQARVHHVRGEGDVARLARLIMGRSLCLVLSGGGARGFAHLGVIKALREVGLVIDAVGGTSIGAIIGAGLAADWSIEEMIEVNRRSFVLTNPISDWTVPLVSMRSGRKVSRLLREAFGEREIEDLVLPFFCVSSNLTDGRATVHRHGPLWQWLRASVAIPGVLPPVFCKGQVYVDGGVINNLPVDIMRESQRGEVIAVDIGGDHAVRATTEEFDLPPWWKLLPELFGFNARKRPTLLQVLLRAGMVNSGAQTLVARKASTLLLRPELESIDLLNWQAFDRAVEIGYQHALRALGTDLESLSAQTPLL
jgi:NTE family protein